jgi:hypothetical protein
VICTFCQLSDTPPTPRWTERERERERNLRIKSSPVDESISGTVRSTCAQELREGGCSSHDASQPSSGTAKPPKTRPMARAGKGKGDSRAREDSARTGGASNPLAVVKRRSGRCTQTHSGRLANGAHEMPTIVPSKTYSASAVRPRLTRWLHAMARRNCSVSAALLVKCAQVVTQLVQRGPSQVLGSPPRFQCSESVVAIWWLADLW